MRVLCTGANGFIGRALCAALLARGHEVQGAVRGPAGASGLPAGVAPAMVGDLGPDTDWAPALAGVEAVFHLAARVHVMVDDPATAPALFRRVNVEGTRRLGEACAAAGVARLVFASSVKVCGEGRARPYTERDPPAPQDAYGRSKREAEDALEALALATGLHVTSLRLPLVYGPEVRGNVRRLLALVARGLPLPLGSVHNRRSLLGQDNAVSALIACAERPENPGGVFLVSDGEDLSTPELIGHLAAGLGVPARLVPCPPALLRLAGRLTGRSELVERLTGSLCVDAGALRAALDWRPPVPAAVGLRQTALWWRAAHRA